MPGRANGARRPGSASGGAHPGATGVSLDAQRLDEPADDELSDEDPDAAAVQWWSEHLAEAPRRPRAPVTDDAGEPGPRVTNHAANHGGTAVAVIDTQAGPSRPRS